MAIDSEDGLWIAFYAGSAVRRYDARNGFKQTHEIKVPAARTTSCTFAGPSLSQLIITTAHKNEPDTTVDDGRTYICEPGFTGTPTRYFAGA
jgi:sugar lactone lactonase YvrE